MKISARIRYSLPEGFTRYFGNTSWVLSEKIIRLCVNLFVSVYVARYLGPARFGLLNYAISFVALFSAIANLGLDEIIVRNLVQHPKQRDSILGTALVLRLAGWIVLLVMVWGSVLIVPSDNLTKLLIIIIAGGMIIQIFNVLDFYFQSQVLARFSSIAQFYSLVIGSVIRVILIVLQAELLWFALAILIDSLVFVAVLIFFYCKRHMRIAGWRFETQLARRLLHDSWPLILSGLAVMIYMRIDQIMIKTLISPAAVGIYVAAVKLAEVWYVIPVAICSALFPAVLNAKKGSTSRYLRRVQLLYDLMTWLAVAIAIPIYLLSPWICMILYGDQYTGSATVLAINIWACIPVFLGVASSRYLVAENATKLVFARSLLGAILNVILNLLWIPDYGIIGAAWATVISYTVSVFALIVSGKGVVTFKMMVCSFFPWKRLAVMMAKQKGGKDDL